MQSKGVEVLFKKSSTTWEKSKRSVTGPFNATQNSVLPKDVLFTNCMVADKFLLGSGINN